MQLHYGDNLATIITDPRIKERHLDRPHILKVKLPRRVKPADKLFRRERLIARAFKRAA